MHLFGKNPRDRNDEKRDDRRIYKRQRDAEKLPQRRNSVNLCRFHDGIRDTAHRARIHEYLNAETGEQSRRYFV